MLEAAAEKISVRRHANGLLKRRERNGVEKGRPCGQRIEADLLADVRLDEFANAISGRAKAPRFRSGASGIGMKLSMLNRGLCVNDCFGQLREKI